MEVCVRWMLLSLLAVWRPQAEAFTFGPVDLHEGEGVEFARYPPAPRRFIASVASSRTGLPGSDSSMNVNQPLGAAPGAWMPRAMMPTCPPDQPFCKTTTPKPDGPSTTTKKLPCPRDRPYCNQPYWGPNLYHHHFVLLSNDKEPHYRGHDHHGDGRRYPAGPHEHGYPTGPHEHGYPTGPHGDGRRYPAGPQERGYPTGPHSDGRRYPAGPQEHGYPTGPHGDGRRYPAGPHEHGDGRRYRTGPHGRPHRQPHWPEAQRHQLQRLEWPELNRG